jgi:hypothetical protein
MPPLHVGSRVIPLLAVNRGLLAVDCLFAARFFPCSTPRPPVLT